VSLKLRTGPLIRVVSVVVGIGLVAYAARQSVLVTAAVLLTMAGLFMATNRRKRRSRYKGPATEITIVALLTLLIWAGIATAFSVADSSDPELLAVSFSGGLTIASIWMVGVLTVAGVSVAWYAFASERRSRHSRRGGRTSRRAVAGEPASTDKPAEASQA
jgi:uncharacterized membrane protein YoaK (UPF0700 family)